MKLSEQILSSFILNAAFFSWENKNVNVHSFLHSFHENCKILPKQQQKSRCVTHGAYAPLFSVFEDSAESIYLDLISLQEQENNENGIVDNNKDGCLRKEQIRRDWIELDEIIEDGDLLESEFEELYGIVANDNNLICSDQNKINKIGFMKLYQSIDDMFVSDDDIESKTNGKNGKEEGGYEIRANDESKDIGNNEVKNLGNEKDSINSVEVEENIGRKSLLSYLRNTPATANNRAYTDTSNAIKDSMVFLPCGIECNEREHEAILRKLLAMEEDANHNIVVKQNGKITAKQLLGDWELLYTSSRTMSINKSLSGLGRTSSSMAQFAGIRMSLTGNQFLGQAKIVETFATASTATIDDAVSGDDIPETATNDNNENEEPLFEVFISGEWLVEDFRRHLYTGKPSTSLRIDPETVQYANLNKNDANEWESLGPIKLVDILYLDDGDDTTKDYALMILRGNINPDSLFVYQKMRKK